MALLKNIPIGSKILDPNTKYLGEPIKWMVVAKNHTGYPSNSVSLLTEKSIGNNKQFEIDPDTTIGIEKPYSKLTLPKWLNSNLANTIGIYGGKTPSYQNEAGFLHGFSNGFQQNILNTQITRNNNVSYSTKVFIPTAWEYGMASGSGLPWWVRRHGSALEYFVNKGNAGRAINTIYWTGTETQPGDSLPYDQFVLIEADGKMKSGKDYYHKFAIRAILNLNGDVKVSDTPNSQGYYELIFNQNPVVSGNNLDLGSKVSNFDIDYTITDSEGHTTTVDIIVDGIKIVTAQSVILGRSYTYNVDISDFTLGQHEIRIVAKDNQGGVSVPRIYTFEKANAAPQFTTQDKNLGNIYSAFTESYRVEDVNAEDSIKVTISLNATQIGNVSSAQGQNLSYTITQEMIDNLPLNSTNVVTLKADDSKGGIAYLRHTFTKVNRPPVIAGANVELGEVTTKPSAFIFSVTDAEKDTISGKIYFNNVEVQDLQSITDNEEFNWEIPHEDWIKIPFDVINTVKLEAWDPNSINNKQVREYTFIKISDGIEIEIKLTETGTSPQKIIAVPVGRFNAELLSVEVCNNYLDETPTWEDMTTEAKTARAYLITNSTKTSENFCTALRIKLASTDGLNMINGVRGGIE